jgi:hypothetical protein
MSPNDELMTAGEAQAYLEVTKVRMASFLRNGDLTVYTKEINRRIKWVRRSEVEALKRRLHDAKEMIPAA